MTISKLVRTVAGSACTIAIVLAGARAAEAAEGEMTLEQCVAANEGAEALRKTSKLIDARKQLRACVAATCPRLVRDDCAAQLDTVEKSIPTIVFAAKGPDGADLVAVKVVIDGVMVAEKLDGAPIEVDPGEHTFELTTEGFPTSTKRLVVREGAKGRQEVVEFGARSAADAQRVRLVVSTESDAVIAIDGRASGTGRFDGPLSAGPHDLRVTKPGKVAFKASIDLRAGETRQMDVALEDAPRRSLVPWLIGGAVVVVAAAAVGGYFLFRSDDPSAPPPSGRLGSVTLGSWGP